MAHVNLTAENPICQSCAAFLQDCCFEIHDFMLWVNKYYPNVHICQGWRSEADQHAYFLAKKSELDWPNSKHNAMEDSIPRSMAVDLFVLADNGTAQFDGAFYKSLYEAAILAGQNIVWGGNWSGFPDEDHFEVES